MSWQTLNYKPIGVNGSALDQTGKGANEAKLVMICWYTDHVQCRKATDPAKDLLDGSSSFKEISAKCAKEETVASDQIQSKEDLLKVIDSKTVNSEVTSLEAQKLLWSTQRKKGLRKFPRLLQSFMTRFADFLEAYAGIVEIVKQADSQYGGLAYSTLSVLLLVMCLASNSKVPF